MSALDVFTGPDTGLQSTCRGDPVPGELKAEFEAVIGSEELGKHTVVIRSIGLD